MPNKATETVSALAPFVRIGLYLLAGWLSGLGMDSHTAEFLRYDLELLAAVTGGLALAWYWLAKRRGWKT
jgi:hypothetical protein